MEFKNTSILLFLQKSRGFHCSWNEENCKNNNKKEWKIKSNFDFIDIIICNSIYANQFLCFIGLLSINIVYYFNLYSYSFETIFIRNGLVT